LGGTSAFALLLAAWRGSQFRTRRFENEALLGSLHMSVSRRACRSFGLLNFEFYEYLRPPKACLTRLMCAIIQVVGAGAFALE
jgi:hypothetical protein